MTTRNARASVTTHPVKPLARTRVLVVGDVMLDRYWFGDVSRISPEAPVPVLKFARLEERPGGAANVARNIAALGARATLLSVVGRDEAGRALESLLKRERVTSRLHRDSSIDTIVKLRVVGPRNHQLLRIDFETPPSHEILRAKLAEYTRLIVGCDAVVLSDYGKGGLAHITRMISLARRYKKPVLVDPKGSDFARYAGATVITPNLDEFRGVAGPWTNEKTFNRQAQDMRARLKLGALLVTRGAGGMTLFEGEARSHVAAQAREVSDVSGAGDTVIATLATMLAAGHDMQTAVQTANRAAGIVVGKFGTAVVHPNELFGEYHLDTARPRKRGAD